MPGARATTYHGVMHEQRWSPKGEARREEILLTAMSELAAHGYGGTTVRAIARAMGLEPAHILYYFGTREALLEALVDRWDARSAPAVSPAHMLDAYVAAIDRNMAQHGIVHLYLAFAAEAANPSHRSHGFFRARFATVHGLLAEAIRAEQQAGRIGVGVDPDGTARELIALADGMQLQALLDPAVDAPAAVDQAVAALRATAP